MYKMKIKNFLLMAACLLYVSCNNSENADYDICVYGGTSAGVIAAYKAAAMGKKVLLIEPGKHLGGMTASGLGLTDIGNKEAISGFTIDFYKRIAAHYGEEGKTKLVFEPHVAENQFNKLVSEAGFNTLLFHRVIDVQKKRKSYKFHPTGKFFAST